MKQLLLLLLLLLLFSTNTSFGQLRFELGGETGLALKDGSHDQIGWGLSLTAELPINGNTSTTLGTGFGRYISTHGIGQTDVTPMKLGVRKYLTSDDEAPEGFFIQFQSGILYYKSGAVHSNATKLDKISPFAGISLGWMNGPKLAPSFSYSWNKYSDYWHQYISFKLSATF